MVYPKEHQLAARRQQHAVSSTASELPLAARPGVVCAGTMGAPGTVTQAHAVVVLEKATPREARVVSSGRRAGAWAKSAYNRYVTAVGAAVLVQLCPGTHFRSCSSK